MVLYLPTSGNSNNVLGVRYLLVVKGQGLSFTDF